MFPLKAFDCFWRETSKDIIEKEVLTMSEKAQEVRRRRLNSMLCLRKAAETTFNFVLQEFDEKTEKGDYTPVLLFIYNKLVYIDLDTKLDYFYIEYNYQNTFFEILEKMFNAEEGYTAKRIDGECGEVPQLIVQIDIV